MIKSSVKKILPRRLIDVLQRFRGRVDVRVARAASFSGWSSVLYYALYNGHFRREMRSVLLARCGYYGKQNAQNPTSYLLRRNIHRLEKGLIMRPRRNIFGEGYIVETVQHFNRCVENNALTETETSWAKDVISEYFAVVSSSGEIDVARAAFRVADNVRETARDSFQKPLAYSTLRSAEISFGQLQTLCQRRHSMRWFEPKRVPRDVIDAAVDVAATAPSACNRQPYKFYVFDQPERAQEIGAIPMGTAGFSHNFQCVVVVVGDLSAYPFEKDRHIIYIDSGLAVMQMQLALETLGLASCCINWPDIERHERQMALELDLAPYQRPVMLLAVGYPLADALVPYSAKKNASDLVVWPE
jgi:nitroreductase